VRPFAPFALAFGLAGAAGAQVRTRSVSLQEAIEAAARAPETRAARLRTRAAGADLRASGAWPTSSLSVGTTRATARLIVAASVPLPVFGTLGANADVARAEVALAHAEETALALDVRRRAVAAWIDLARAEERRVLLEAATSREDTLAAFARRRFEEGDASHAEAVLAGAAAARLRAEAGVARLAIDGASATLAGALGWDPSIPLHAEGGLPAPADPGRLDDRLAHAREHPNVKVAAARVSSLRAQAMEARRFQWPALSVEGEADIDDPTLPGTDLRAALLLEIPFFGGRSAAAAAASARHAAARAELDATRRATSADAAIAARRLEAALLGARALADEVAPVQRESAVLARRAYEEGAGSLVTVLEAERILAEVEVERVDALAEAALAQADLEAALGSSE